MGYCHPVRIKDANEFRKNLDGYTGYGYWATKWKPQDNIPYRIPAQIDKVFVVCYNDAPADKKISITTAGQFLLEYARTITDEGATC
jgi:hypothetical protein